MDPYFLELANKAIRTLKPYQPGKPISELQREYQLSRIVKLASNENPLGPSPRALTAASTALAECGRYPDPEAYNLKQALAKHCHVEAAQLTLGNGSDNLLAMLVQTFVQPGQTVLMPEYSFATFTIVSRTHHAHVVYAPSKEWRCDVQALLDAITPETRMIFIANPNNPTGTCINQMELVQLLANIPKQVLVILDEAYYEYCQQADYPHSMALQQQYPQLVITRTFSKAYGLAGLRIGYAISHPDIANLLNRVRLPFNISLPAQAAAIAALQDQEHVQRGLGINQQGIKQLRQALVQLNLKSIPSVTNFITVDFEQTAAPIYQALLKRGIIVRPLLPYNMPNHLRISIGTPDENDYLIEQLSKILSKEYSHD